MFVIEMGGALDIELIRNAFARLGNRLRADRKIEVLIAGGAAGVLTSLLPRDWVTADVDAIHFDPSDDTDDVLRAVGEIRQELSLPPDWLNEHSRLHFHALPKGWEHRRQLVGAFGPLTVWAIGRLDLIAMKFVAHRQEGLEHLAVIVPAVGSEDLAFVRQHLQALSRDSVLDAGRIAMSQAYVKEWHAGGRS